MSTKSTISPWVWITLLLIAGAAATYLAVPRVRRVVFKKPPEVKIIAYAI